MKAGWKLKTLGELFDITSSKRVFKHDWKSEGVPFYRAREIVRLAKNGFADNELFISEEMFQQYTRKYGAPAQGDILVTGVGTLGICYVVKDKDKFYFKDGNIIWLKKTEKDVESRFIEYGFKSDLLREQIDDAVGATVGTYTIIKAKGTKVPIPPLEEQRRIVAVLDEAFAGIATATTNAQKNLTNARELFEGHLLSVFEDQQNRSPKRPFDSCLSPVKYTAKIQRKDFQREGRFPIVSQESGLINGRWDQISDVFKISRPLIIFGDHTQVLKYVDFDFVLGADGVKLLLPTKDLTAKFLMYFLKANPIKSIGYARHYRLLKDLSVPIPPLPEQTAINEMLDEVSEKIDDLNDLYNTKLAALADLKQSLLQKAFAGELT